MLDIKQLTKRYGRFTALDHIDLRVEEGSIFGFVGPNGAGKTTTMRILAALMPPTSGDASIDGVSVVDNPRQIRRMIGYMPDFFGVYDDLKVSEYLDFYGSAAGLDYKDRKKSAADLLALVYLDGKEDVYVDTLSRGMKQRLCLARSLISNPRLLILDEPASGMDPRARIEMKNILRALKDMNKTILISSHILPELAELCDTIGIIEHGKFLFTGSLEEIGVKMHGGKMLSIVAPGKGEAAALFLREQPEIGELSREGDEITAAFTGDDEAAQRLLRAMVLADLPILGFGIRQENLENVFLEVTRDEEE